MAQVLPLCPYSQNTNLKMLTGFSLSAKYCTFFSRYIPGWFKRSQEQFLQQDQGVKINREWRNCPRTERLKRHHNPMQLTLLHLESIRKQTCVRQSLKVAYGLVWILSSKKLLLILLGVTEALWLYIEMSIIFKVIRMLIHRGGVTWDLGFLLK